jgi:hypothetical protein
MNLTNSNWFVGTTKPMTSYPGMRVGVSAGFNITIEYPNNLNVTEPALPNTFANLTVANSVSGEFFFQMTVNDQVYALGGIVHDAATGARLAAASVTLELAPGDNNTTTTTSTGSFSFAGVPNGTYQMAISAPGYSSGVQTVRVAGQNVLTDVPMTHASGGSKAWWSAGGAVGGVPLLFVGVAVLVAALAAVILIRRRRTEPASKTGSPGDSADSPPARPDGP